MMTRCRAVAMASLSTELQNEIRRSVEEMMKGKTRYIYRLAIHLWYCSIPLPLLQIQMMQADPFY